MLILVRPLSDPKGDSDQKTMTCSIPNLTTNVKVILIERKALLITLNDATLLCFQILLDTIE